MAAQGVVGVDPEGAVVEDDDEGYRTSPGSDTSPQSNNTASPPPKMAKKVWSAVISHFFYSYISTFTGFIFSRLFIYELNYI